MSENKESMDVKDISGRKILRRSATVKAVIDGKDCPLPLQVIPNYMGINLCSVESISWTKLNDGQLVDITINFMPLESGPEEMPVEDTKQCEKNGICIGDIGQCDHAG